MPHTQPDGFQALPPTGTGSGVLVLHAWWGLNDTVKAFCSRLAAAGFTAFAPDLYHGQVAEDIPAAEALGQSLDNRYEQVRAEILEAARFLQDQTRQDSPGLAVIGFSLGAFYALDLSAAAPDLVHSVVVYYGTGPADFERSRAAYLGHFAGQDEYEPQENIDQLQQVLKLAGRPVTIYYYPGVGHWFCEPDRPDAYNAESAELAWERTLAFLNRTEA